MKAILSAWLLVSLALGGLAGCEKPPGPGERAGEAIDKAVDKAGQQVEKAGESIRDAARGEKR